MKKQEALKELQKKVDSVNTWKSIVDTAVEDYDPNLPHYMKVLEGTIKELYKAYDLLKIFISLRVE